MAMFNLINVDMGVIVLGGFLWRKDSKDGKERGGGMLKNLFFLIFERS